MDKPQVAFVGLGKMGLAMAANLQRAGYPLVVWNRSAEKAAPLTAVGASLAKTPAAAARAPDIVISSLADDASLRAVVSGPDGVLAGLRPARFSKAPVAGRKFAGGRQVFEVAAVVEAPVVVRPRRRQVKKTLKRKRVPSPFSTTPIGRRLLLLFNRCNCCLVCLVCLLPLLCSRRR